MKNKVFLTGGAGFIGSHLLDSLLQNDCEVFVVDNFSSGREENIKHNLSNPNFHLLKSDIQSIETKNVLIKFKPDAVVHLAAQMNVRRSVADPIYDAEQNIFGTINLLQAAELAGVKKFIFSSTGGAIYGEQEYFPADETHITRPECPYGLSKRSAELYIEYFSRKNVMPSFSLRFGNVYGPRQNPHGEAGVVSIFVEQVFEGKPLTVNGDGNQTRDFIFVQDIVKAITLILDENYSVGNSIYQVFNLGTGVESSVKDIINSLSDICKNETPEMSFDISYRPQPEGEQMRSLLDASLFSKNYDWSPKINLKDGLAQTFLEAKKLLT